MQSAHVGGVDTEISEGFTYFGKTVQDIGRFGHYVFKQSSLAHADRNSPNTNTVIPQYVKRLCPAISGVAFSKPYSKCLSMLY